MCHPERPEGESSPTVRNEEVLVPLSTGEAMPALLSHAVDDGGGGPGVVVVADRMGRSPFYEHLAALLAAAGCTALVPDYFFRQGPLAERTPEAATARRAGLDQHRTLDDLADAVGWLRRSLGDSGRRTGTLGFCIGGTFVLDLAARVDHLATVCFYGFPAGDRRPTSLSAPPPLDLVDDIAGPVLGFWGEDDEGAGMSNVARLADELHRRGVVFEHTIYPGVGHGFFGRSRLDPDHEAYAAASDAWSRTIAFYREQLT